MNNIGSKALLKCINYLTDKGYEMIDVPFYVDKDVSSFTRPEFKKDYHHGNDTSHNVYVASGEQSFLQLIKDGILTSGKYITLTPCVRDEYLSELSDIKLKVFMKLELISLTDSLDKAKVLLNQILFDMINFYTDYFNITILPIDDTSIDLVVNDIELASYGIRNYNGQYYVYGTGIALPRFNKLFEKYGLK